MTIDEIIEELEDSKDYPTSDPASDEALNGAIEIMRKYQMFQDQSLSIYMERLKADMVAMLEDLYMEIEELDTPSDDSYDAGIVDCEGIIQAKINALKKNEVEP